VIAVEWSNVHLAGAFVIGATLGSIATIRIMRHVLRTFEFERDRQHFDRDRPKGEH
jgi:hypothetical protein